MREEFGVSKCLKKIKEYYKIPHFSAPYNKVSQKRRTLHKEKLQGSFE